MADKTSEQEASGRETVTRLAQRLHHLRSTASCAGIYNSPYHQGYHPTAFGVPVEEQYKGLSGPAKQAGLTVEERKSFSKLLADADLVDAFRAKHPDALGIFSYYSQRVVQNRPMNRGLRLDYVLASPSLKLADAFILSTDEAWPFADHSPVGAVFQLD